MNGEACQRGDHGGASLLIATVVVIAAVIAAVGLLVGAFAVAQHDAAGSADLVALSAATRYAGGGDACQAAGAVAQSNGVSLTSCRVDGDALDFVVSVSVSRSLHLPLGLTATATASAHAGRLEPVG